MCRRPSDKCIEMCRPAPKIRDFRISDLSIIRSEDHKANGGGPWVYCFLDPRNEVIEILICPLFRAGHRALHYLRMLFLRAAGQIHQQKKPAPIRTTSPKKKNGITLGRQPVIGITWSLQAAASSLPNSEQGQAGEDIFGLTGECAQGTFSFLL